MGNIAEAARAREKAARANRKAGRTDGYYWVSSDGVLEVWHWAHGSWFAPACEQSQLEPDAVIERVAEPQPPGG